MTAKSDSGSKTEGSGSPRAQVHGTISADQMLDRLNKSVSAQDVAAAVIALSDYVGADGYLLARHELNSEAGLDNVISSNWPFDLVRNKGRELLARLSRSTELEKCLSVLNPAFSLLVDDQNTVGDPGREYCTIIFNAGRTRYCLMFICPQDVILSQQRLRETGLLAGYLASLLFRDAVRSVRDMDLTDRELECLYWIAEGKTSDEIATIIGISKNTINNYITSVMRKTATRTRSEAIAYAVRHNLV
ncbi:DNA-binding CsgD family transcriptional regulator [Rhizobium sp. SG_E_25_P2]|uniref:transcriptional regulator VisN n=1 Tax=Rhizobium sp. SG_E_25_P2 TaxID=2879942 RepID=UPI002474511E|nr:helix-turn-helix transcriptional regulator [Rhizobium sp. SG_E_25_P2]MDH6266431.1 DNA-binding CsgD family transcriptional regulator [Rhizobium sp. SG_E_25_P2]